LERREMNMMQQYRQIDFLCQICDEAGYSSLEEMVSIAPGLFEESSKSFRASEEYHQVEAEKEAWEWYEAAPMYSF
jgi:hypothetical protein